MARRSTKAVTEAEATVAQPETQDEGTMTVTDTVAPEATEGTETPAEGAETEAEDFDLTALNAALANILAGDVSDPGAIDFASLREAYNALPRTGKSAATRELGEKSRTLLESGEFESARAVLAASKAVKGTTGKSGAGRPAKQVDPTEAVVTKLTGLQVAYALVQANLPDGVAENWQDQVSGNFDSVYAEAVKLHEYNENEAEDKGDAPEVSAAAQFAVRQAFVQRRKAYRPRRDVGKHIAQVMANKPVGEVVSVSELSDSLSDEYGDEKPGSSPVNNRLKAKADLPEGLERVTEGDKVIGVRRVA